MQVMCWRVVERVAHIPILDDGLNFLIKHWNTWGSGRQVPANITDVIRYGGPIQVAPVQQCIILLCIKQENVQFGSFV